MRFKKLLIGILLLILGISYSIWYINTNGGEYNYLYKEPVCPKCGKELRWFNTDSHGNRGFCCDDCQYYTWI